MSEHREEHEVYGTDNDNSDKFQDTRADTGSSESSINNEVRGFVAEDVQQEPQLQRQPSIVERVQTRLSFFNERLKTERFGLVKSFLRTYLIMIACILGIFSIYWGASYDRFSRLPNLKMLVVIEDEAVGGVDPVIGNSIREVLSTPQAQKLGGWDIVDLSKFAQTAKDHDNSIHDEVVRQIHHQLYWSSIYVTKNASADYKNWVETGDKSVNISNLVYSIYETGRDALNMQSSVTPQIEKIEKMWLGQQSNLSELFATNENFSIAEATRLATPVTFNFHDYRPFTDAVLTAPSQVGLIYIIILTFFQVNMFTEVHQQVSQYGLKTKHYVLYRLFSSYFSYFVLSLAYSLVTLAFQVDFNMTFGKAGFLVYWMFSYITMISVGLMNEVAFMILVMTFPPLVGFWLLFWVLINISSTFAPIALCPEFYRFGYAMPIHNSYELTKVVFFDTYKGQMGRNIGIIFAWIVLGTIAFSLLLKPFGIKMKQRAIAAAKKQAADRAEKEREEQEKQQRYQEEV